MQLYIYEMSQKLLFYLEISPSPSWLESVFLTETHDINDMNLYQLMQMDIYIREWPWICTCLQVYERITCCTAMIAASARPGTKLAGTAMEL